MYLCNYCARYNVDELCQLICHVVCKNIDYSCIGRHEQTVIAKIIIGKRNVV